MKNISYMKNYNSDRGDCSTVIIGKDASVTGNVIIGHNEDDNDCYVETHLVPRMKHVDGEVITFADGKAVIPQVNETYAYYWSEARCEGGISFADSFINEWGVAVVTNACRPSKDETGCTKDNRESYGVGYGLRCLIAQRAKTAREGVKVIAEIVEKFGYFSSRSYHIADKNEAWVVQIPKGYNIVAKKLGDDQVYYIPNHYTIHKIDFEDKENYYYSPNLVPHAIKMGWYKPEKEGDWSDFDFAKVYQEGELKYGNETRAKTAWKILKNVDLNDDTIRTFSMKADRKYSAEDVKKVLRSHDEGMPFDKTNNYEINPHAPDVITVCNKMTIESIVIEFNEDVNLTRMLRALSKPCTSPYTPWYPVALLKVPVGYENIPALPAIESHFYVDKKEFKYDPTKAWWIIKTLNYFTDFDYKGTHEVIHSSIEDVEKQWEIEKAGIENAYLSVKNDNLKAAKEILSSYTCAQAEKTLDWVKEMIVYLGEKKVNENIEVWNNLK